MILKQHIKNPTVIVPKFIDVLSVIIKQGTIVCLALLFSIITTRAFSQVTDEQIIQTISQKDSLFWVAYNSCDTEGFRKFCWNDIEFYHDKSGIAEGADTIVSSFAKNLCMENFRLRREAVEGTVHIFPLRNGSLVYGAVITGEHVFYIAEKGKAERRDGLAKFTHTWIVADSAWKMTRILSYDHKPAPYINKKKEISLSASVLKRYAGQYTGAQTGTIEVKPGKGFLILLINKKESKIYPEQNAVFFSKEQDLVFQFVETNKVNTKMIVLERGEVVEELNFLTK